MVGINLLPFCNRTGHCHINMNHEYINLFFPKRLVWFILIKSEYCSVMLYWIIHLFIKMPTIFKLESNHTGMEANVKKKRYVIYFVPDYCTPRDRFVYDMRERVVWWSPCCRIIRLQLCRNLSSMGSWFHFVGPGKWTHQQPTTIGPGDIFAGDTTIKEPISTGCYAKGLRYWFSKPVLWNRD